MQSLLLVASARQTRLTSINQKLNCLKLDSLDDSFDRQFDGDQILVAISNSKLLNKLGSTLSHWTSVRASELQIKYRLDYHQIRIGILKFIEQTVIVLSCSLRTLIYTL